MPFLKQSLVNTTGDQQSIQVSSAGVKMSSIKLSMFMITGPAHLLLRLTLHTLLTGVIYAHFALYF